jgi:hypothetical protein
METTGRGWPEGKGCLGRLASESVQIQRSKRPKIWIVSHAKTRTATNNATLPPMRPSTPCRARLPHHLVLCPAGLPDDGDGAWSIGGWDCDRIRFPRAAAPPHCTALPTRAGMHACMPRNRMHAMHAWIPSEFQTYYPMSPS